MSSTFNHCFDRFLRVGDSVRSRHENERPALDVSLLRRSAARNKRGAGHAEDTDNTTMTRDTSVVEDFTTMEGLWKSATKGTWISHTEIESIVGFIKSINTVNKTAEVTVWKRGTKTTADQQRRPVDVVPLQDLVKISPHDFDVTVKKEYMKDATYQLKMRNDGFDDSAPFALIAYNNKIISALMGKIDTSAKISMKDIRRKRPQGPGALIHAPIPPMPVDVVDPLHAARAELEGLQNCGIRTNRSRSALEGKKPDKDTLQVERRVCSRGSAALALSLTEENILDEKRRTANHVAVMLNTAVKHRHPFSMCPVLPRVGNGSKTFISSLDEFEDEGRKLKVFVTEIRRDGALMVRMRSDSTLLLCYIHGIVLSASEATFAQLSALKNSEADVVPIAKHSSGSCSARIYINGERLQSHLVRNGLASVLNSGREDDGTAELLMLQKDAMAKRLGMWSADDISVNDVMKMDALIEECNPMPSLFGAFESSMGVSERRRVD